MKKIIGFSIMALLAVGMFVNSNSLQDSSDVNLASLMAIQTANAEEGCNLHCRETFLLGGIGWERICHSCTMMYFIHPRGYLGCCDII